MPKRVEIPGPRAARIATASAGEAAPKAIRDLILDGEPPAGAGRLRHAYRGLTAGYPGDAFGEGSVPVGS